MKNKLKHPMRILVGATMLAGGLLCSCITFSSKAVDGLQPAFASHVPARTAVLGCQEWPALQETVKNPADRKWLCDRLDDAVLDGFRAQPYMRGFSSKVVEKLLEQAKWPTAVSEGVAMIVEAAKKSGCESKVDPFCGSAARLYEDTLAGNAAWQMWLSRFSDTQKHADAVLIPFLLAAVDDKFNDRGLVAVSRSVTYSLWLVETTNGRLIWTRTKSGLETLRALPEKSASLAAPQWDVPANRVLTSDFWRDYPGRIVLD